MNSLKLFTVGVALLACRQRVSAQSISPSVLNATGGSHSVGGNTYEWSVGEMTLVNTASAAGITVTQGLLQPIQGTPSAIQPSVILADELLVFPVPSTSVLHIKPAFKTPGNMKLAVTDAAGRTVLQSAVVLQTGHELQQINISTLANGNYMLNISYEAAGSSSHQSYKIQKIN